MLEQNDQELKRCQVCGAQSNRNPSHGMCQLLYGYCVDPIDTLQNSKYREIDTSSEWLCHGCFVECIVRYQMVWEGPAAIQP